MLAKETSEGTNAILMLQHLNRNKKTIKEVFGKPYNFNFSVIFVQEMEV